MTVGREREIERIIQILSRRTKNNPCLIGEPGVGKTAIVEGLAQRIVNEEVPEPMRGQACRDAGYGGHGGRIQVPRRVRGADQADHCRSTSTAEMSCSFIDELHTIIGAGGAEGAMDASNILKPSLARGELQLIGATTLEEYRKYIEKDPALERRFQPVHVEEPTEEETHGDFKGTRVRYYEKHHGVTITDEALEAAVKLSVRYINDRFLPDKAIDLIDEASARQQLGYFHAEFPRIEKLQEEYRGVAGRA